MPSLRETQAVFAAAVLGADSAALEATIAHDGLAPAARLAIHRHHVRTSLREVLEGVYPVVCRLVDRRFFAYAAERYIAAHPPTGPCLFEYGDTFAAFLAGFPPCRELVYLPDVARLEWAMHRAMHADDAAALDLGVLADGDADALHRITMRLHPSLTLLDSPWPVEHIWRANRPGPNSDAVVNLDAGPSHIEVRRAGDDVVFTTLSEPVYALRRALHEGRSLGAAAAAALSVARAGDLATELRDLFRDGLVVAITLTAKEDDR